MILLQSTNWQNFYGGTIKGGLNYNINKNMRLFLNTGYFSKQPIFNSIFLSYRNLINEEATNQTVKLTKLDIVILIIILMLI